MRLEEINKAFKYYRLAILSILVMVFTTVFILNLYACEDLIGLCISLSVLRGLLVVSIGILFIHVAITQSTLVYKIDDSGNLHFFRLFHTIIVCFNDLDRVIFFSSYGTMATYKSITFVYHREKKIRVTYRRIGYAEERLLLHIRKMGKKIEVKGRLGAYHQDILSREL